MYFCIVKCIGGYETMNSYFSKRNLILCILLMVVCNISNADDRHYRKARTFHAEGMFDEAVSLYKEHLSQPVDANDPNQIVGYTEALVQMMNAYQSKGEPEACVVALEELFHDAPILQKECLRDYYSVLGYALSRTEKMRQAEEATLKVFTLPLNFSTPERYFRDYAYAAAVFYSNPDYQDEVVHWCEKALEQADMCGNMSGSQWVSAMLGSAYKRNGQLNKALELFLQSKDEARQRKDYLGELNTLHALIDLFLYWDVPEYADLYSTEAIRFQEGLKISNPMVCAQTYINKGRALLELGKTDSISFYTEKARELCRSLPYNSGMVDVDLLHGIYLTMAGGDSLHLGIEELLHVSRQGTPTNRAKAFHQLGQTYLRIGNDDMAETMLDNMWSLLNQGNSSVYIHIDYEPILNHYQRKGDKAKVEQYVGMMLQERESLKEKRLNYNLVEAIVLQQTEQKDQELRIAQLKQANQRLWLVVCIIAFIICILSVAVYIIYQKKTHLMQMRQERVKLDALMQKLDQSNTEKEMIAKEIDEIMNDKESRLELEALTPSILQKEGESKFRQRFELLYPLFLPRLRERVPSITRREELLSMLIVLKQDNKEIADLFAVAPRSVLMLRHRFRQKIGMTTEKSLEVFIEENMK